MPGFGSTPTRGISAADPAAAAYHGEDQASGGTLAAFPVRAVDTVGAGGTFTGALALALAAGAGPERALAPAAWPYVAT